MKSFGLLSLAALCIAFAAPAHADADVKGYLRDSARALKLQDWNVAVRLARAAIAEQGISNTDATVAHNNLCVGLVNMRAPEALAACNKSVELTNGYWGCLVNRGHLYTQLGERKLAAADYAQAATLSDQAADLRRTERLMPYGESLKFVAMQPKG